MKLIERIMPKKKKVELMKVPVEGATLTIEGLEELAGGTIASIPNIEEAPLEIERVKYGPLEVVEVLNDGKETATEYHCLMSNDTTMHVPKSLFI